MDTSTTSEFGPMHFDGSDWKLERTVQFNGVAVAVKIEPEDAEKQAISPVQEEALRLLFALPPDVLEQAAPAVVQNYEVYRDMIGDDELPPLSAPVEVWDKVSLTDFTVPAHRDVTIPTFLLFAECEWDEEHGLVVRFRNGQADESNQQGDLGVED